MAPEKKKAESKLKNGYITRHEEVAAGQTRAGCISEVRVRGGATQDERGYRCRGEHGRHRERLSHLTDVTLLLQLLQRSPGGPGDTEGATSGSQL